MDIIKEKSNEDWNWWELSKILFTKDRELFMKRKMRAHLAAFKIQTYWRRANYDPEYELCKRRIKWEYDALGIN